MNQKGFANVIIIIVLGVIALGTGIGLRYFQDSVKEKTTAQKTNSVPEVTEKKVFVPPGIVTVPIGPEKENSMTKDRKDFIGQPAVVLPHLIKNGGGVNDVGTVVLSQKNLSSYSPLFKSAKAQVVSNIPQRVISYIDKDPQSGFNQLFLYALGVGEKIKITNEPKEKVIAKAQLVDDPLSLVVYVTDSPSASLHAVNIGDLFNRSFSIGHDNESIFAVNSARSLLANFRVEVNSNQLLLRNLFDPNLSIVKTYSNPTADLNRGWMSTSGFIVWSSNGKSIYLQKPLGNKGWEIIEFNLETEKTRSLVSYNDNYLTNRELNLWSMSLSFNNNRLYFVTIGRTDMTSQDYNFILNELDVLSGEIKAQFNDMAGSLFSSDGTKIYYETNKPVSAFVEYSRDTNNKKTLFAQSEFIKKQGGDIKYLTLIGFGLTENELIFMTQPAKENGSRLNKFYSYSINTGEFTELFSANPISSKGFSG